MQKEMYPAQVNSLQTELAVAIDAGQTTIILADASVVPIAPNLLTIGTDESAETVLYTGKSGNDLTGVTRGFQGTAQSWPAGSKVARYFTAYDADTFRENIAVLQNELSDVTLIKETIKSGAQVIQGGVAPAIAYPDVEGRTLINLLGNAGGCERVDGWSQTGTAAIDSTTKVSGASSIRVTLPGSNGNIARTVSCVVGKNYLLVAEVKNGTTTSVRVSVTGIADGNGVTSTTAFKTSFLKFTATGINHMVAVVGSGAVGQHFNADSVRVYELSATEYTEIDNLTADQIAAKYPYVGTGIHGIKDVTVTSVQDNLLPPFSEWSLHANAKIVNPYELKITPTAIDQSSYITIPVAIGETYTFSSELIGSGIGAVYRGTLNNMGSGTGYTFTVDESFHGFVTVFVSNGAISEATIKNPLLAKGIEAQPFKPQSKTTLTAYTELYSNTEGTIADKLEYVSGKPKKVKRYEKVILDGSLNWNFESKSNGIHTVACTINEEAIHSFLHQWITKYNGLILTIGVDGNLNGVDNSTFNKRLFLRISSADSGWGDGYTPTTAEIKAYFNGYMMYSYDTNVAPYNGTGRKSWISLDEFGIGSTITRVNDVAPTGRPQSVGRKSWKPYELLYQLSTPTLEDAQTSGAIVIESGDNHVTVNSSNVPINPSTLSYADSFYSALSDMGREIVRVDLVRAKDKETIILKSKTDLYKLRTPGNYFIYDAVGAPFVGVSLYVEVKRIEYSGTTAISQSIKEWGTNTIFERVLVGNGEFSPWAEVWTTANSPMDPSALGGYQKLPSGLIIQWGQLGVPTGATGAIVVFPLVFPSQTVTVLGMADATVGVPISSAAVSKSQCTLLQGGGGPVVVRWLAIGL